VSSWNPKLGFVMISFIRENEDFLGKKRWRELKSLDIRFEDSGSKRVRLNSNNLG
jgi:hypothetical protein